MQQLMNLKMCIIMDTFWPAYSFYTNTRVQNTYQNTFMYDIDLPAEELNTFIFNKYQKLSSHNSIRQIQCKSYLFFA